ncbi:ThiF family adenylyltransferase [Paenibacillus beijingensis]|uniref:Thiamine biosynthesis protein ThiF n=1 Tax=Paenibacillus beijingensis TaxID=1126833 RepID=A0A0D5NLT0_9BACL|nr:ThiF family adenylyltransferase [Paenibacillus beijingensis]AJY75962.1 thiamine biosynthesis protein ThiF [Paenibacillus beijingensis]
MTDMPSSSLRYARQIRFSPLGESGQTKLGQSYAVVVGMGALGSVIAQHLVRCGVGRVRLIDRDIVEWSNLQRQMLYREDDVRGMLPKAEAAARYLRSVNGSVEIEPVVADVTSGNVSDLLAGADLIMDGTDNYTIRYLLNDYSVSSGIPWIYGGAVGASGVTMTIVPGQTPCYRCLYPEPPAVGTTDTCETAGVLPTIIDMIGSLQATEAIKWLSGNRDALHGTIVQLDVWRHSWFPVAVGRSRRADCPCCGERRFPFLDGSEEPVSSALCGRSSVQITPARPVKLELDQVAEAFQKIGPVTVNPFLLRLELTGGLSFLLFKDGRALVQGTEDPIKAKAVYAELMGY